jgi:phosphoglucosamine mutase
MTRKYFGTDGIRGRANAYPMTAEIALKVGMAAGLEFRQNGRRNKVIIAKDTRLSGYMIEPALTAGFVAVGMDVTGAFHAGGFGGDDFCVPQFV